MRWNRSGPQARFLGLPVATHAIITTYLCCRRVFLNFLFPPAASLYKPEESAGNRLLVRNPSYGSSRTASHLADILHRIFFFSLNQNLRRTARSKAGQLAQTCMPNWSIDKRSAHVHQTRLEEPHEKGGSFEMFFKKKVVANVTINQWNAC
jgi:hypothetical protein